MLTRLVLLIVVIGSLMVASPRAAGAFQWVQLACP